MKTTKLTFAFLIAIGALFVSCKKEIAQTKLETATTTSNQIAKAETTSFNIEGMTCAVGCAKTIENKLAGLEGIQKATVDFDKKTATIQYDAAIQTPEKLVEFVEAVADGKTYKVSNVKSSADKAMLYQEKQDQEKDKKADRKKKKSKASPDEASASTTTLAKEEKKAGCCAGKKACSSEKPATM
ncbi:heavy-metal-associated domain-containing protein [Flavobacterium sp.]|uniref:heavy-metal-associated domain-containing protein n=1 Tax=Flavobacterium sp. TaxID=239 RepID=UPI003750416C